MANKKAVSSISAEEAAWDESEETAEDPFAIDFFSQTGTITVAAEEVFDDEQIVAPQLLTAERTLAARLWNADLPRVNSDEVRKTLVLTDFPSQLGEKICELVGGTLGQILLQNNSELNCEIAASVESLLSHEIAQAASEQAVFVHFSLESSRSAVGILKLDADFAVSVIAKALASENSVFSERRKLSATEFAVLEFFALNCLRQINEYAQTPFLKLQTVSQTPTDFIEQRCLRFDVRLRLGDVLSVVQLILPFDFLSNLNSASFFSKRQNKDKISAFSHFGTGFKTSLIVGSTVIDAGDLTVLERDDVILVERPTVRFGAGNLSGRAEVRIADDPAGVLFGELSGEDNLSFLVREINQKTRNYSPKRLQMPDEQSEVNDEQLSAVPPSEDEDSGLALEKIIVNLSVELASRRLTLDELSQLKVGQTIELGSRPTDPVELVADGRTVAVGELVDVEGNLGVRLTRILL